MGVCTCVYVCVCASAHASKLCACVCACNCMCICVCVIVCVCVCVCVCVHSCDRIYDNIAEMFTGLFYKLLHYVRLQQFSAGFKVSDVGLL